MLFGIRQGILFISTLNQATHHSNTLARCQVPHLSRVSVLVLVLVMMLTPGEPWLLACVPMVPWAIHG